MIKKFVILFLLLFSCVILNGCVKYETTIQIDKNEKTDISFYAGFDVTTLYTAMGMLEDKNNKTADLGKLKDAIRQQLEEGLIQAKEQNKDFNGYETKIKEDGNFVGYYFQKSFKNFKEVTLLPYFINKQKNFVEIKNTMFKKNYLIYFEVDFEKMNEMFNGNNENTAQENVLGYSKDNQTPVNKPKIYSKFTIKIPYKAVETNAQETDDKSFIYTWNMPIDTTIKQPIILIYETLNIPNIILFVSVLMIIFIFIKTTHTEERPY